MAFHETPDYIVGDIGGACWFCQTAQRVVDGRHERLFRSDRDIDFEGFVVVCETCVAELADQCGWVAPANAEAQARKAKAQAKELSDAKRQLHAATAALAALNELAEARAG